MTIVRCPARNTASFFGVHAYQMQKWVKDLHECMRERSRVQHVSGDARLAGFLMPLCPYVQSGQAGGRASAVRPHKRARWGPVKFLKALLLHHLGALMHAV